jgi:hydroxymethylpyrimidine pyrophosphatase-like HAD family hydrolase
MVIAVDFDGTIVEHRYPSIGNEKPFAINALKAIQKARHRVILWTFRSGKELEEALEFCSKRGLEFYAVNKNYPEEEYDGSYSRKICADIYIDDRNVGGLPEWGQIYRMICPDAYAKKQQELFHKRNKLSWFFG